MMRKQILMILALITILSCKQDKEIMSIDIVDKLSDGNYKVPSRYGNIDLFILLENQEIIVTNTDYLSYVYDFHFKTKFKTYKEFLSKVLNQKTILNKNAFGGIPYKMFKIDKLVEKNYQDLGFKKFFNKYTIKNKSEKDVYNLNVTNMKPDEIMSVSYFLYLNGYQTKLNDYFPKYVVRSRNKILEISENH